MQTMVGYLFCFPSQPTSEQCHWMFKPLTAGLEVDKGFKALKGNGLKAFTPGGH